MGFFDHFPKPGSSPVRDNQRQRVYRAERSTPMWLGDAKRTDLRDRSIAAAQEFASRVARNRWVIKKLGKLAIVVEPSYGRGGAHASGRTIRVSEYYRCKLIILHEMAHCYVTYRYHRKAAWHGPEFAQTYLTLVRLAMGRAAEKELAAAFKAGGVRTRAKKVLSPEAKARLLARLGRHNPVAATPSSVPEPERPNRQRDIALALANSV